MEKSHTIDLVFVLLLFCVFSMSALTVVYIGSHVYSSTVETLEYNYGHNTVGDYIKEKVRQNLSEDQIEVKTFDEKDVLCIHSLENNISYTTYIYSDQGELKELFVNDEQGFHIENGETIMEVDEVHFSINKSLLTIEICMNNQTQESYIALIGGKV